MLTDFQRFVIEARMSIWARSFERKLSLRKMEDLQMAVSDHLIYVVADPFKDLVTRLLDEPSCLWDELN